MTNFSTSQKHTFEGFDPEIQPTKSENRIARNKIKVESLQEQDLSEWATICYEAFPDAFWSKVELPSRPSVEIRIERLAKHFKPWITVPGFHAIKAVNEDNGEIMGVAGWHEIGKHHIFPQSYAGFPTELLFHDAYVPNCWRDDLVDVLGFKEKEGWADAEVKQMYAHHSLNYFEEFVIYETGRIREMRRQPHWYLSPLCVKRRYQAKGVGMALMRYGLEKADDAVPPLPVILETLPNVIPMYTHLGFEPTSDHGPSKSTQYVRPPVLKSKDKI